MTDSVNSFRPPNVRFALPGFAPGVRDAIYSHVYADPANEVGGLLAGDRRPDGVMVVGAVRAQGASGDVTSLTFTHEAWTNMLAELEAQYPGAEIVGWYHSHPGHGIFLSRHDEFIHRNFFPAAWQFAIVVDPHHHDEGLFMWREGNLPRVAAAAVDPRWAGPQPLAAQRPPAQRRRVPPTQRSPSPDPAGPLEPLQPERPTEPSVDAGAPRRDPRRQPRSAQDRARDRELRARRRAEFARDPSSRPAPVQARAIAAARAGAVVAIGFAIGAVVLLLT
ncbi:MAG: Mov34/MPN/PAD-1 family protein [Solirubrobacteraceae bacterium]|nr:Mov34/MPN/PAD-1 family protein [Solirubrobacteraceae bacterium]